MIRLAPEHCLLIAIHITQNTNKGFKLHEKPNNSATFFTGTKNCINCFRALEAEKRFAISKIMNINNLTENLIDRFWKWRLRDIPEFATFVGDHNHDDRLMDLSLNGYLRRRDDARQWLSETLQIRDIAKIEELDNEAKTHLDYLQNDMEIFLEGLKFQTYLCPLNQIDGPHRRFPILLSQMPKETIKDYENIISRLRLFPNQINQMIELMLEGIRLGKTAHATTVQSYPEILQEISQTDVTESKVFTPFKKRPTKISLEDWKKITTEAKEVISDHTLPAFKCLGEFIRDEYIPKTRSGLGVSSLPDGIELYNTYVRFHTDRGVSPKEMYDLGKKMLKELHEELEKQKDCYGFQGTAKEFISDLRHNGAYHFTTRDDMKSTYEIVTKTIRDESSKLFEKLPDMPYEIIPAPAEIEKEYCAGAYIAGSPENKRPGYFVVNFYQPWNRKRMDMMCLILHETYPGHHVQLSLTAESGQKDYRRFADELRVWDQPAHVGQKSAYHEGWATYAEYLGHEMGLFGKKGSCDYIKCLSRDMQLACRLVVDVGLNLYEWPLEEARNFLLDNCVNCELEIESELKRFIALPGQGLSYEYGRRRMIEFRQKATNELGDQFDLPSFHTMLATLGDVPMFIVENKVEEYIKDRKQQ